MKPKGLLVAVVLLAVLGGLVWWSNKKQAATPRRTTTATTKILTIPDDQFQEHPDQEGDRRGHRPQPGQRQVGVTEPKPLPADQDTVSSLVSSLGCAQRRQDHRREGRRPQAVWSGQPDARRHDQAQGRQNRRGADRRRHPERLGRLCQVAHRSARLHHRHLHQVQHRQAARRFPRQAPPDLRLRTS